jgi:translation initiation factor 5
LFVIVSFFLSFFLSFVGAQTTYAPETDRAVVNGAHRDADLQNHLSKYIENFVLCQNCKLPETHYKIKDGIVSQKCLACGHKESVDMTHKLTTFILSQYKKAKDAKKVAEKLEAKKEKKEKKGDKPEKGEKVEKNGKEKEENGKISKMTSNDDGDASAAPVSKPKKSSKASTSTSSLSSLDNTNGATPENVFTSATATAALEDETDSTAAGK